MKSPDGSHHGLLVPPASEVAWTGSPPSGEINWIWPSANKRDPRAVQACAKDPAAVRVAVGQAALHGARRAASATSWRFPRGAHPVRRP